MQTDRCTLRTLGLDDVDDLYTWAKNPLVSQYMSWSAHKTRADSQAFIDAVNVREARGQMMTFGIVLRETDKLIGTCGFSEWCGQEGRAEIAFALAPEYWGKGLMTECLAPLVALGFSRGLTRIQATCEVPNDASKRVLSKLGFKFEGVLANHTLDKAGCPIDLEMYALVANRSC